jgi:site-specific DNA recombinase
MKVAIFCRVSTDEQALKGVSLRDQEERGKLFCIENNYDYEVFREPGYSGELPLHERPIFFELLQRTELDKNQKSDFQAVYLIDFDRISRDEGIFATIKNHFILNKTIIFDKGVAIDLNDPTQNLLVSIKGSLAAYENKKLRERIKRSLERSVIEGKAGGGAVLVYGYAKDVDGRLVVDDFEAQVVKRIFQLSIDGLGTKQIANNLNEEGIPTKRGRSKNGSLKVNGQKKTNFVWRDSVVYGILKNSIYIGQRRFKGKLYPCPSIINDEQFHFVQKAFKSRANFKDTTNKYHYLLKGMLICGNCGQRFYGRKRQDLSDNQYICCSQRYGEFCGNRGINIDRLDDVVWSQLMMLPKNIRKLVITSKDNYTQDLLEKLKKAKEQLTVYESRKSRLINLFLKNPDIEKTLEDDVVKIAHKIENKKNEIDKYDREILMASSHGKLVQELSKQINPYKLKKPDEVTMQKIVRSFINFIIIKWREDISTHVLCVDFKIDKLSDLYIQGLSSVGYEKIGWSFKQKDISFGFRIIDPKIQVIQDNDGKMKYEVFLGKTDFGFNILDDPFSISKMPFYSTIKSHTKKKKDNIK